MEFFLVILAHCGFSHQSTCWWEALAGLNISIFHSLSFVHCILYEVWEREWLWCISMQFRVDTDAILEAVVQSFFTKNVQNVLTISYACQIRLNSLNWLTCIKHYCHKRKYERSHLLKIILNINNSRKRSKPCSEDSYILREGLTIEKGVFVFFKTRKNIFF